MDMPGRTPFLRDVLAVQLVNRLLSSSQNWITADYSILMPDAGDGIRFDHGMYFLALSDHYEVQFDRRKRVSGDVDHRCPSAIRIDGIGAAAGRPFHRWRYAADKDVVHLGQITLAVKIGHGYAADREPSPGRKRRPGVGEDQAFYSEPVIA